MRIWLIRTEAPSVDVNEKSSRVLIRSRNRPSIKEGDELMLVKWLGGDAAFTHTTKVRTTEQLKSATTDELGVTEILVEEWSPLRRTVELALLRYSLRFIWNVEKPYLHFRRGYRILPDQDFDTIVAGEPFIARTMYFELLNALPVPMRRTYEAEQLLGVPEVKSEFIFAERATVLYEFINKRVLLAGNLLMALDEIIKSAELVTEDGSQILHALYDDDVEDGPNARRPDNIATQAESFRMLRGELDQALDADSGTLGEDAIWQILGEMRQPHRFTLERRFEVLFQEAA